MSRTIMVACHFFVSELWPFDCFVLILCNFNFCTPHNSIIYQDIFMKFYRNVYKVKTTIVCLQVLPFDYFFHFFKKNLYVP